MFFALDLFFISVALDFHPGHKIASRQMQLGGGGGMVSFCVKGEDESNAVSVAANCKIFKRATSLGGTESLIEHRRSIEPEWSTTPATLLRLSVGLEHTPDLIKDLENSLNSL